MGEGTPGRSVMVEKGVKPLTITPRAGRERVGKRISQPLTALISDHWPNNQKPEHKGEPVQRSAPEDTAGERMLENGCGGAK